MSMITITTTCLNDKCEAVGRPSVFNIQTVAPGVGMIGEMYCLLCGYRMRTETTHA